MQQDRDRLKRYSTRILFGGRRGGNDMTNILDVHMLYHNLMFS